MTVINRSLRPVGGSGEERLQIIAGIRNRFFQEGLALESITFDDWINHIKNL